MAELRFKLNTGAEIPALGLGTWQSAPGEVQRAISYATSIGYRHIDCAWCYGNENEVGEGIAQALKSGVKREDLFVTTKLWCTYHSRVEENLDTSLNSLGLDYVDLYLMHWPVAMNPNGNDQRFPRLADGSIDVAKDWSHIQTWKAMESLLASGKVKAIGVCNYSVKFLEELLAHATVMPAVNQIENHPSLPQQDVIDFCKARDIHVTAYSPLGSMGSPLMEEKAITDVAERLNVSPAHVLLSYHRMIPYLHLIRGKDQADSVPQVTRGSSVLAKSVTPSRIKANMELRRLSRGDMESLDRYSTDLTQAGKLIRYVKRDYGIDLGFPDVV